MVSNMSHESVFSLVMSRLSSPRYSFVTMLNWPITDQTKQPNEPLVTRLIAKSTCFLSNRRGGHYILPMFGWPGNLLVDLYKQIWKGLLLGFLSWIWLFVSLYLTVILPSYLCKASKLMSTPVERSPWQQGMRSPLYINWHSVCCGSLAPRLPGDHSGWAVWGIRWDWIEVDSEHFLRIREPSIKSLMADLALCVI